MGGLGTGSEFNKRLYSFTFVLLASWFLASFNSPSRKQTSQHLQCECISMISRHTLRVSKKQHRRCSVGYARRRS